MKTKSKLLAGSGVSALLAICVAAFAPWKTTNPEQHAAFQTIDAAFAIHRDQGWSVTSAPTDQKRYRLCGATQSDPTSGVASFSGGFQTGNRSVDFEVTVGEDTIVAVEGLDPIDGGPLTYAVLTREVAH